LSSKVFGGSVLVKRINGRKSPLKDQIEGDATSFVPRIKRALVVDTEKFYVLNNVQMKKGYPDFVDISIYIKSIADPEQKRMIEDCHYISSLNISNWQSQMLYPYTHQFVIFDDIKSALTGFGRMMSYRCLAKNKRGDFDPTFDAEKLNWIMEIKEGEFYQGEASGY